MWATRSLLERGHSVVALDEEQRAAVVHVQGDITDLDALERVLAEHEITKVIHLAALQVPFVRADPALGARVNVLGTVNVLEAVRRREGIGAVVYASSIESAYSRGMTAARRGQI